MINLPLEANANAVRFLKTQARPLEAELYAYEFEGRGPDAAIMALTAFQNPDGGFGHALEPDIRLDDSSVIATTIAFQHFRTLKLPIDHPILAAACGYLNAQYLPDEKRWAIIPANIDDAPHAPWWEYGGDLSNSSANPTAEVLGYLYEYALHFSDDLRTEVGQAISAYLSAQGEKMDMHELLCYVALVENPAVPADFKASMMPKLTSIVSNTVERDRDKWKDYTIPPLAVVSSPDSPFAPLFADILPDNLDFMMSWQSADGGWHPNWDWGHSPEVWAEAERDWTGVQTLANLKKLRAFGRL